MRVFDSLSFLLYSRPTTPEGCTVILGQLLFDRARAMEEPSRRCGRSFFAISGGHVASTRDFAGGMWQTYIKGGRILIYPPIRVGLAVGGVEVLRP